MKKPNPEFAIYQYWVYLIGKMMIKGRQIEKPDLEFAHHIYILMQIGNSDPERVYS